MADDSPNARPAAPTTPAEIERSIRVIQIAVAGAVAVMVALTIVFIAAFDAPAVPLVPIAALVIGVDLAFLVTFTRQRRRALEEMRRREAGLA